MQTTYKFEPQDDLTVLDLAEILDIPTLSQADFDKLPARLKRHFKAGQVFERPIPETLPEPPAPDMELGLFTKSVREHGRGRKSK